MRSATAAVAPVRPVQTLEHPLKPPFWYAGYVADHEFNLVRIRTNNFTAISRFRRKAEGPLAVMSALRCVPAVRLYFLTLVVAQHRKLSQIVNVQIDRMGIHRHLEDWSAAWSLPGDCNCYAATLTSLRRSARLIGIGGVFGRILWFRAATPRKH